MRVGECFITNSSCLLSNRKLSFWNDIIFLQKLNVLQMAEKIGKVNPIVCVPVGGNPDMVYYFYFPLLKYNIAVCVYVVWFFSSSEPKIQVTFSNHPLSLVPPSVFMFVRQSVCLSVKYSHIFTSLEPLGQT